ncbi:MAG: VOC family protein, partial [Calditrichaeota bacterium]
ESWGDVPSHWLVYFAVEDCDATVKTAQSLGGQVLVSPSDIPGVGRFAILQDPQGAVFAIIKLEPAAQN